MTGREPAGTGLAELAALVAARVGIDPLKRDREAFARRVAACAGAGGPAGLLAEISAGGSLDALVEALVVPETRFFRDPDHYDYLASVLLPALAAHLRDAIVRRVSLLSIGCSTGQEAWSLGATLLAARDRFPEGTEFRVLGVDLSARALLRAETGVYGPEERRGLDDGTARAWFRAEGDSLSAGPELRAVVRFRRANLLDPEFRASVEGRAHAVFLKNVLFYFTPEAAEKALAAAASLVAPGGALVLAPSETRRGAPRGFREVDHGRAVIHVRDEARGMPGGGR